MPLSTTTVTLVLDGQVQAARAAYVKRMRPFSAGYRVRAIGTAAVTVFGFNHPGTLPSNQLTRAKGYGGSGVVYTFGTTTTGTTNFIALSGANLLSGFATTGATAAISGGSAMESGATMLGVQLLVYPEKSPELATLIPRVPTTGAGIVTGAQCFAVAGGSGITVMYAPTSTGNGGVPVGYVLDLIVPNSGNITTLATIAAASRFYDFASKDFMAVGAVDSGAASITAAKQ